MNVIKREQAAKKGTGRNTIGKNTKTVHWGRKIGRNQKWGPAIITAREGKTS